MWEDMKIHEFQVSMSFLALLQSTIRRLWLLHVVTALCLVPQKANLYSGLKPKSSQAQLSQVVLTHEWKIHVCFKLINFLICCLCRILAAKYKIFLAELWSSNRFPYTNMIYKCYSIKISYSPYTANKSKTKNTHCIIVLLWSCRIGKTSPWW